MEEECERVEGVEDTPSKSLDYMLLHEMGTPVQAVTSRNI